MELGQVFIAEANLFNPLEHCEFEIESLFPFTTAAAAGSDGEHDHDYRSD